MKRPTFIEGVIIAAIASLLGSVVYNSLTGFIGGASALKLIVAVVSFVYIMYLLRKSDDKTGRISITVMWLALSTLVYVFTDSVFLFMILHMTLIWLIRSLYFYSSPLSSLADLGLSSLSLAAAFWAGAQTNSIFLSIWCFFLVQALFVIIPKSFQIKSSNKLQIEEAEDRFERAYRTAEDAVRKLSTKLAR